MTTRLATRSLADVLSSGVVSSVFQPIFDVETLQPVAFEALARGPLGTPWESPAALLAAAAAEGRLAECDWACRAAAYRAALDVGLQHRSAVFVNVEPATIGSPVPPEVVRLERDALDRLHVVLEITERAVLARPAEVLAACRWARRHGWGVALDDVGAEDGSLAMLPLLDPDVVKLDLQLIQRRPDVHVASTMTAVLAHAERSGALVLVEGVETTEHLARARALGARLVQGFLLGRPSPHIPGELPRQSVELVRRPVPEGRCDTPFEVVAASRPTYPSTKAMLIEMSKHLETEAAHSFAPAVVLSAFQDSGHLTPATIFRYRELAKRCAFVAAFGRRLPHQPEGGVRYAPLAPGDALSGEWSVVVVGAHYAAALVARDLGDSGPQADRRFEYALTHERGLVLDSARTLLRRVLPQSPPF